MFAITNQGSPYLTIPRFPGDLGVFEKYGNETKEARHERERERGL